MPVVHGRRDVHLVPRHGEDTLWDTITTLSIVVCFYCGFTALSGSWYFRRRALREGWRPTLTGVVLPGIGGIMLLLIFAQTLS